MIAKDFAQQLFDLHDRVAFVTGAGSGIGQMIALALASAGARVVCFDLREDGGLKETVNHIEALGGQALYYTGDVRELRDLRAAVALAKTHFGRLDIAVNAAGIANANPALEMESEQWQRVIDINLTGVWNSCKAEAELMVENGGGSIINIASMSGIIVNRGLEQAHYNSSKAGVIHLSKSLAMEWVSKGIRVNSISPGYTATPMNTRPEMVHQTREFESQTPIQRMAKVEEMAGPALFLASDAASFCTGVDLVVDGRFATPEAKAANDKGRKFFADMHRKDLHDDAEWMAKQVYLNVGNFLLGVAALGLDAVPIEGFDAAILDEEFGLKEKGYTSLVVVPVGHHSVEDFNATLPKSRLPQNITLTEV